MLDKLIDLPVSMPMGALLVIVAVCLAVMNIRSVRKPSSLTIIIVFALCGIASIASGLLGGRTCAPSPY